MINSILLQAQAQGGSPWSMIIMMVAIFAIFYFFMIRPQNQKQKKIQEARAKLDKGDKVITQGGIYGVIDRVENDRFIISIADGVKIRVDKNCVYPVAESDSAVQDGKQNQQ